MTRVATCVVGLMTACGAHCAPFADPTRPPREVEPSNASAGAPGAPRLESVLIAPDRRIAVINGQQFIEGARFGDGRVLRITQTEVVIRHAGNDEILKLLPQAGKRTRGDAREKK